MNNQPLTGKTALVTGASKGIGAAIAKHLAAAGAAVAVNYSSSKEGADAVVAHITNAGGKAIAVQGNLAQAETAQKVVETAQKAFGHLDILVNNAGVYEFAPLEAVTEEHFHKQFNLNVLGLLMVTQAAVKAFPATGGSIINISSVVSRITPPNASVYSATKAAVDAITTSLAQELGPRGIRVNAINPGMVLTEGVQNAGIHESEMRTHIEATAPLRRIGQVDDIAPAAVFLASPASGYLTGETIHIGGGIR